jgi:hypothetical protein
MHRIGWFYYLIGGFCILKVLNFINVSYIRWPHLM